MYNRDHGDRNRPENREIPPRLFNDIEGILQQAVPGIQINIMQNIVPDLQQAMQHQHPGEAIFEIRNGDIVPRGAAMPRDRDKDEVREARYERVTVDADVLSYNPNADHEIGAYIGGQPISPEWNYFEIEILETNKGVAIGLVPYDYPLDRFPGWQDCSAGYHSYQGRLLNGSRRYKSFGQKCHYGDRMGCGVIYGHEEGAPHKAVFTKNGREVGRAPLQLPPDGTLYPSVGLMSDGDEVRLILDAEFHQDNVILMAVDNYEEEWARLHAVRLNGSYLEYTGWGKSIMDVGLAQARHPLDTTHHYFELEITDPGENCYIAIGLARKDYPRYRHPGWNKGSIAYHADDGKIFIGSGVGIPFGPKCHKGDIMGCGIHFPRDYNSDLDSDGSTAGTPDDLDIEQDDPLPDSPFGDDGEDDFDEEDRENWGMMDRGAVKLEYGAEVKIFFTRNGKTVGSRTTQIPRGGFYPTVGMLSSDEKVRVDLRPLTG